MATHAPAPRAPHQLGSTRPEAVEHRRPLPTRETAPPPPPKSPVQKPKKIVLPSPPPVIRDQHRGISFKRCNFLGEGGFARVYEVADDDNNRQAVKVVAKVNLQSKKSKTKLYAEIKLHRALRHPNIVLFNDCFEDDDHVYMSLELCENGSLNDLLRKRKRYTEPEARFFVMQLIGACYYMHDHQVIHRDLKLGNIFLDRNMNVKVGDFGLAALIETPGDRKKTICGTPNYIAPEVLFDTANGHSFEVDTWSIGVILYTLLVGRPPFQTSDVKSIYDRIKHNNYEFPANKPVSPDAQELIQGILTHNPQQRPSLHAIADHDFFTNGIFPASIPISAHESAPIFQLTRTQSRTNYMRVRRSVLLDAEDTEIRAVDVDEPGSLLDTAGSQHQQKQEREFHRAVQPGSPISALLKSAREPLLVSKSPLRVSVTSARQREREAIENRPPLPVNSKTLIKKLSTASATGSAVDGKPTLSSTTTSFPPPPPVHDIVVPTPAERPSRLPSSGLGINGNGRLRSVSGASTATTMSATYLPTSGSASSSKTLTVPASPVRQPLQSLQPLPSLQEEQEEARRQYDLASQKARIVKQMAVVNEVEGESDGAAPVLGRGVRGGGSTRERMRERENNKEIQPQSRIRAPSQRSEIPAGRGLAEEDTEGIKPIRERKISHKSKGSIASPQKPSKLRGYEEVASTLDDAFKCLEVGKRWRKPEDYEHLKGPQVYIQSWVDYCNKYGMGYALTNGCVGVHFNDSTTMILSADKHNFEYLSSRRNGAAYVRKNYTVDQYPADLKSKVYLLKHFERYILDKLLGTTDNDDADKKVDMVFVHKYLRMTNVLLFKLSHDVLQFNFFDHTKLLLSHGGQHVVYFDKHGARHSATLASIMEQLRESPSSLAEDQKRFNIKLQRKLSFCKDLLQHILSYSGSQVEESASLVNLEA